MPTIKDWEETGGQPQPSPERPGGKAALSSDRAAAGAGPRFGKPSFFDPIARRHLVELIGGAVVIFSVIYVMIPVFSGTAESSRRAVCVTHLHRLVQAAQMYETDNEAPPPTQSWTHALYQYILDPGRTGHPNPGFQGGLDALFCPSESSLPALKRKRVRNISSYSYLSPRERRLTGDETTTPLFWDRMGGIGRAAHPGGGNVGYMDGHSAWLPAQKWTAGDLP